MLTAEDVRARAEAGKAKKRAAATQEFLNGDGQRWKVVAEMIYTDLAARADYGYASTVINLEEAFGRKLKPKEDDLLANYFRDMGFEVKFSYSSNSYNETLTVNA